MKKFFEEVNAYVIEEDTKLRVYLKKLEARLRAKNKTENAEICKEIVSSLDYHIRKNKGENTDKSILQDIQDELF